MTPHPRYGIGADENGDPLAMVLPYAIELTCPARTKDAVETEQIESFLGAYLPTMVNTVRHRPRARP